MGRFRFSGSYFLEALDDFLDDSLDDCVRDFYEILQKIMKSVLDPGFLDPDPW